MKAQDGSIGSPCLAYQDVVTYEDTIRDELAKAPADRRRLTLAGFVARLLSFPLFRGVGFTLDLFRQALFTNLLEATVAPTRMTMKSLEQPLDVVRSKGKYVWGDQFWNFLNTLGAYLDNNTIDDPEVESFEEEAVLLITFHQAKGLEFDHVYVAGTGRDIDLAPALRTKLFSGETVKFRLDGDTLKTEDQDTNRLATADREREVYVAMTRAKKTLTILDDPNASVNYMSLNPGIVALFSKKKSRWYAGSTTVTVLEAQ
jgi:DNA helicase-2/ATP-dependent DNA helicase PcrA